MPVGTNATGIPASIQPIQRPQQAPGSTAVVRTGDGSSGFTPRTDLAIKNAVDDMASVLAEISKEQADSVGKMP